MTRFNKTFWLILFITLFILILASIFVIRPIVTNILDTYLNLSIAQNELRKIEQERDVLINAQKSKEDFDKLYAKINTFLPEKIKEGDFVVQLDTIAKQTNQNQTEINIKDEKNKKKSTASDEETDTKKTTTKTEQKSSDSSVKQKNFTISQKGSFPDLVNFLEDLEQASRLNTIENLTLKLEDDNSLTTKIEGLIYYKQAFSIQDILANLEITPQERTQINDLEHFGEIIEIKSLDDVKGGRGDPFAPF